MFGGKAEAASRFARALQSSGGDTSQGTSFNIGHIQLVIRKDEKGALSYIDCVCDIAADRPDQLQLALLVAIAWYIDTRDGAPMNKVIHRAEEVGATHYLGDVNHQLAMVAAARQGGGEI